ncbi:MAG: DUF4838 domain-containing protein [Lentisphaeria bacterium]|nr:DUF4838 domain-containing protein [Lentisphaeria bacterium]
MKLLAVSAVFLAAMEIVCADPAVVYSAGATGAEKTAVRELVNHLTAVLGRKVPAVREDAAPASGRLIYVGRTDFAAKHADLPKFQPEESLLRSVGKDLIITGGRPRGTLYGVYEFLERVAGVVWLDEKNSHIPRDPGLKWENLEIRTLPAFRWRGIYTTPIWCGNNREERLQFLSRCRENIFWQCNITAKERERWGISPVLGRPAPLNTMHFYSARWPKEGMESARSLNKNGDRDVSQSFAGPGQICFSGPLARRTVARQLGEFIEADRREFPDCPPPLYNLSINDTHDRCECRECVGRAEKYRSYAGTVLEFVNSVADSIRESYPDVRIQTSAYLFTEKAPEGISPRPNVVVRLSPSPWGSNCQTMVPLDSSVNRKTLDDMKKWSAMGKIQIWNYWVLFGNYAGKNAGVTGISAVTENLKIFHRLGSDYVFSECEFPDTASFHGLRVYLGYQLLRDPFQPVEPLLDRYFAAAFGPAAKSMREFFDCQQKRQAAGPQRDMMDSSMRPWLDAEFFRTAEKCFSEAEKAAAGNERLLRRIRQERVPADIARLSIRTLGPDRAAAERLRKNWEAALDRWYAKPWPKREADNLKNFMKKIEVPEKGAKYPLPEDLAGRVLYDITWPEFNTVTELASYGLRLADDPEAAGGKAMCLAEPKRTPVKGFHSKNLQAGVFSRSRRTTLTVKVFPVKSDEKYHFYDLGRAKLDPVSLVYIHRMWFLQQHLDRYYLAGEKNEYDVRISLKAQGPAYCPGSSKPDALWVDRILLLAPDGQK